MQSRLTYFFFCSLSDFLVTPTLFPLRGLQPVQFAHKAAAALHNALISATVVRRHLRSSRAADFSVTLNKLNQTSGRKPPSDRAACVRLLKVCSFLCTLYMHGFLFI